MSQLGQAGVPTRGESKVGRRDLRWTPKRVHGDSRKGGMIKETVPECSPNYHLFKGLNDTRKNTLRGDLIKPCPVGEIGPQEPADLQGLPPWSTSGAHPEAQKPAQRNRELQTELEPFLLDFLSALLSASLPSFPATELRKTLLTVHAPFAGKQATQTSHGSFSVAPFLS